MLSKFYNLKMLFIIMLYSFNGLAQDIPFNCDFDAYLFQYNDVYAIDLASGNSFQVATDVTPGSINATAYNPADGYIWGALSTPEKSIVRIGKDFNSTTFYIDDMPANKNFVGDITSTGIYYLKGGGEDYHTIDLDSNSINYTKYLATSKLSQSLNIHDWAFNAVDNLLYAVEKNSNILYRIDPTNGEVMALGEVPILSGLSYTYGAVYFDNEGRFYVSSNQTGTIYVIQSVQNIETVEDIDSNLFAFGPSSASNDGARCPTAPVPQEICDNGIDDDGDGLVDCEDPSCSGYGECDVIAAPTSSSNSGGLESNSRLSEQISKRNFNRAKSGYKFNQATAQRIVKNTNYTRSNPNFTLQDFVPLNSINEDEIIEASPTDLASITNATDIFSVDYLKDSSAVASILVMKTDSGVYEHTKYICDRLLGAELISVSTINIKGEEFIKALIKNETGGFEFVLSLSAKVVNEDANFAIESHWNLDQYEKRAAFYNFQIWAKSVDDLYILGNEVLNLLDVQKPIYTYNNSKPPTVFVRKGGYKDGALDLQIINTNGTESVNFSAGYRATETQSFDTMTTIVNLDGNYITDLQIHTGNLFDIGFRIGDSSYIQDDLFMSDGPWGKDDSDPNTNLSFYNITRNDYQFNINDFPVERNVELTATTSTYISAYRALTPRFKALDLTDFNQLSLQASGTGRLEITLLKESISDWSNQFKTTIELTENIADYNIPISSFKSLSNDELSLIDVVSIVFTMVSETGEVMTKTMALNNIRFSEENISSSTIYKSDINAITAFPNPMSLSTKIQFSASQADNIQIVLYDQLGKMAQQTSFRAESGTNNVEISRQNLSSGIYFIKIYSQADSYSSLKLVVR